MKYAMDLPSTRPLVRAMQSAARRTPLTADDRARIELYLAEGSVERVARAGAAVGKVAVRGFAGDGIDGGEERT